MSKKMCFERASIPELLEKEAVGVAAGHAHWDLWDKPVAMIKHKEASGNDDYLQVIPYMNLYYIHPEEGCKFFVYERSSRSGEQGLVAQNSIGVGGHVDVIDNSLSIIENIATNAARELVEEVGFIDYDKAYRTVLTMLEQGHFLLMYSGANAVDRVHLGLGLSIRVDLTDIGKYDDIEILNPEWISPIELLKPYEEQESATVENDDGSLTPVDETRGFKLENWSEMLLFHLMRR